MSGKSQRLRDPVHGLISFSTDRFDQLIWSLIATREFQRLRRIRQLGFSELVFPGATHTRFSHSIGVFHNARELVRLLKELLREGFEEKQAQLATCAALLHDVGHGPFSHAFESAIKAGDRAKKKHEQWTAEIICGDTEIYQILQDYDASLPQRVAEFFSEDRVNTIYSSIVSSQFDADRLDYLRRDKAMTGTDHGGFDWAWLLDCLRIHRFTLSVDGEEGYDERDALVLSHKGLQAAEGYLLGRFHLYLQVYLHKTTRGAEQMLKALLGRIIDLVSQQQAAQTNLPESSPLLRFLEDQTLSNYLALDDTVIWGSLSWLVESEDEVITELARRLRDRRLYKCFDVAAQVNGRVDAAARFRKSLKDSIANGDLRADFGSPGFKVVRHSH